MEGIQIGIDVLGQIVWGAPMQILLLGTGLYLTLRTGCFQLRHTGLWMKKTLLTLFSPTARAAQKGNKTISSFQSFTTALAGTMGTGNIAGVATALSLGGPGAIFWMWVAGFLGMMTKYAEIVLGALYRTNNRAGGYAGGPMLYLERGMGSRTFALLFALCAVIVSFAMGNMTQASSMTESVIGSFPRLPRVAVALALTPATAFAVWGGLGRIARMTERVIPLFSIAYLGGCAIILFGYRHVIPHAFAQILRAAFSPASAAAGAGGYGMIRALRYGIARGVFSNEAGLGSSALIHAASAEDDPVQEGMWGIFEVFCDTLVCCTATALCLLVTGAWQTPVSGAAMALEAFSMGLPYGGRLFFMLSIVFFSFSTIISWNCCGEQAVRYLWGEGALPLYRAIYVLFSAAGCLISPGIIWSIADIGNGLMALPNLVGILSLSGFVNKGTRDYLKRWKSNRQGRL